MSKPEDFLPYEMGYLTPEMEKMAEEQLGETEEVRNRCIAELRALLSKEKNLYCRMDDNWMLMFLRSRKFNVHRAFKTILNCFKMRKEYRHIFDNENNEPVHDLLRKNFCGFLPYRDGHGRVIGIGKIGRWDPQTMPRDLIFWAAVHGGFFSIEDPATQVVGYTIIADLSGCGFRHLRQCTLENIKLARHLTLKCFPGLNVELHVVGTPAVFSLGYKLLYPFVPVELRDRIHIHGNNFASLHKAIPPCILPSEYGGGLGPFTNKPWHDFMLSKNDMMLKHRFYGYQEPDSEHHSSEDTTNTHQS